MVLALGASVASHVTETLKKYITSNYPLIKELFVNLGNVKTVRVLSYYPGFENIINRELSWSVTSPVSCPDATVWLWREIGSADFLGRVLGVDDDKEQEPARWVELFHPDSEGGMCGMASIDTEGEWGVHYSFNNEYFYGLDGLGPSDWFKEGHFIVQAFFRILNLPSTSLVHGACVGLENTGVLMCARGGGGKSTLSVQAMLKGFDYVSDDYLILHKTDEGLRASPIYSFITLSPEMYEKMYDDLDRARFLGVSPWKGKYIFDIYGYRDRFRDHYPVKALLFPEINMDATSPSIAKCSQSEKGKTMVQVAHSTVSQMGFNGFKGGQKDRDFILKTINMLSGLDCYKITLCPDILANVECLRGLVLSL
ncbi:MAG: hypothetical protein IKW89_06260 [Bacteroidales bacterium]|nr:hypothetical protein [Bacteroidales bacterium]